VPVWPPWRAWPADARPDRLVAEDDGGGFLVSFPDFAACISDGETIDQSLGNGRDALKATIAALKAMKFAVPAPNSGGVASGKFVARAPKTIHARRAPPDDSLKKSDSAIPSSCAPHKRRSPAARAAGLLSL